MSVRDRAEDMGLTIEWRDDEDPDLSWLAPGETVSEVLVCLVRDRRGQVLEALGGITDPDQAYARQIEQEMLAEAIASMRASVFEAI